MKINDIINIINIDCGLIKNEKINIKIVIKLFPFKKK
jgi:hypothetical protein